MVSISRLSSEEYDYLLANGWFVAGSELRHANTTLAPIISLEYADELGDAFVSYIGGGAGLDWNYSLPFTDRGGAAILPPLFAQKGARACYWSGILGRW